jgi:hypothetical protein
MPIGKFPHYFPPNFPHYSAPPSAGMSIRKRQKQSNLSQPVENNNATELKAVPRIRVNSGGAGSNNGKSGSKKCIDVGWFYYKQGIFWVQLATTHSADEGEGEPCSELEDKFGSQQHFHQNPRQKHRRFIVGRPPREGAESPASCPGDSAGGTMELAIMGGGPKEPSDGSLGKRQIII